jgi:DNA-binding XRE family transcriptional regulator
MKSANKAQRGPYGDASKSHGIKALRIKAGMTQRQCAAFCQVSLRTYERAESGDVVPLHVKRSIERTLGVRW